MAVTSWSPVQYDRIDFRGGLDLVTPTYNLPSGTCRSALNFEVSFTGGYRRIAGYERYDGHASPSQQTYAALQLTNISGTPVGSVITGATSGATATVCSIVQIAGYLNTACYTNLTGTFQVGESIKVGGVSVASVLALFASIGDPYTNAVATAGAADIWRSYISAVPGSGSVLGVQYLNQVLYAWRANNLGTVANLYKATSSGWVQVPYGYELNYTTGAGTQPAAGATVTGGTSGATGVIAAVINETGTIVSGVATWAGSSGRFILSSTTGTFQSGEALKVSGSTVATAPATGFLATAIAPLPGGTYRFCQAGFGGAPNQGTQIWGCDGVNRCFSFDGTTYIPIRVLPAAQQAQDRPQVIWAHLNYLIVAIGASVNIGGLGQPYQFNALAGGAEILLPEACTNAYSLPGNQATGALYLGTLNTTSILYGTSPPTFQLVPYNIKTGSASGSCANLADLYIWEQRGAVSLTTTLAYGNFDPAFLTMNIQPFVVGHQGLLVGAIAHRSKSQYRVFFAGGDALYLTFLNKQCLGSMPVNFPNPVTCLCEGPGATQSQRIFFGSSNGMVYEMDAGTSFDGGAIPAQFVLVINPTGTPRVHKRYRRASFEIIGGSYSTFQFSYSLGWGASTIGQPAAAAGVLPFSIPQWDSSYWDSFYWDGTTLTPLEVEMVGTAENVAFAVSSSTNYMQPYTINSAFIHYSMRRGIR